MPDKTDERDALEQLVSAAKAMLAGQLSFIEGSRRISELRFKAGLANDPDVTTLVAVDSETDELPFGEQRTLWDPAALAALSPELENAELWARDVAAPACERLLRRLVSSQG